MIKGGQFLSARIDVLPPEITDELAGLQDEVPPVEFSAIRRLAEAELGAPLEEVYQEFEFDAARSSFARASSPGLPQYTPSGRRSDEQHFDPNF